MSKSKKVRKETDTKKISLSSKTYDRLFDVAMDIWAIERKELEENGVNKRALLNSGLTEKQAHKAVMSNPPCPEATTIMAITALEERLEKVKRNLNLFPKTEVSSKTLN